MQKETGAVCGVLPIATCRTFLFDTLYRFDQLPRLQDEANLRLSKLATQMKCLRDGCQYVSAQYPGDYAGFCCKHCHDGDPARAHDPACEQIPFFEFPVTDVQISEILQKMYRRSPCPTDETVRKNVLDHRKDLLLRVLNAGPNDPLSVMYIQKAKSMFFLAGEHSKVEDQASVEALFWSVMGEQKDPDQKIKVLEFFKDHWPQYYGGHFDEKISCGLFFHGGGGHQFWVYPERVPLIDPVWDTHLCARDFCGNATPDAGSPDIHQQNKTKTRKPILWGYKCGGHSFDLESVDLNDLSIQLAIEQDLHGVSSGIGLLSILEKHCNSENVAAVRYLIEKKNLAGKLARSGLFYHGTPNTKQFWVYPEWHPLVNTQWDTHMCARDFCGNATPVGGSPRIDQLNRTKRCRKPILHEYLCGGHSFESGLQLQIQLEIERELRSGISLLSILEKHCKSNNVAAVRYLIEKIK
jgi:hypothetical protein